VGTHLEGERKANLKNPALLSNRLDLRVRNGQGGQTKGIPVGPDTSLLVSEVILCRLDQQLQELWPTTLRSASRFMDDLEAYAATRGEAEGILMTWDSALSGFDLTLNAAKTSIVEGPVAPERPWRAPLSQFTVRRGRDREYTNDLISLFSMALDFHRRYPTDFVLTLILQPTLRDVTFGVRCGA